LARCSISLRLGGGLCPNIAAQRLQHEHAEQHAGGDIGIIDRNRAALHLHAQPSGKRANEHVKAGQVLARIDERDLRAVRWCRS
jgi:hypothetical protein